MRLKYLNFLFLVLLLMPANLVRADLTPDACRDRLEESRQSFLQGLRELEDLYDRKQDWYLKYWDRAYTLAWQAKQKKDDLFSPARRNEGGLLSSRHDALAEGELSLAEEARGNMREKLVELRKKIPEMRKCCDAAQTQLCLEKWLEGIDRKLTDIEKLILLQETDENEFSARMRASVDESQSDHGDLPLRYAERFQNWAVLGKFRMMRKVRELDELMEYESPADSCCSHCIEKELRISNDPVLERLKPDAQGDTGVAGKIVNQASLKTAFKRYEEEKKKKTR